MPAKYGVISKAYVEPTKLQNAGIGSIPSTLDMYILSSNNQGQLVICSAALKQNLSTYLSQYRIIGDTISIKDAFIINIGIDFDIIVLPDYVNSEVLSNCIAELQAYFAISEWQINEPIIIRELYLLLDRVVYPSIDPMIFEVKSSQNDIRGRVVPL